MKKSIKPGKIIISAGTLPETHELETANTLATLGKNVEFLKPSRKKGAKTPDIEIDGVRWEIKSPCGDSRRTIENNFRNAQRQSEKIIFDLRRIRISEETAIKYVKQQFVLRYGRVKQIMIITKDDKILDLSR